MLTGLQQIIFQWNKLLNPNVYKNLLLDVGIAIQHSIQSKTARGRDYKGTPFIPYSDAYRKWKDKKYGYGPVNLKLTGQMLNSLTQEVDTHKVVVGFDNEKADKKAFHNEEGRVPRKFVAVGPDTEKVLDDMVVKYIDNLLGI